MNRFYKLVNKLYTIINRFYIIVNIFYNMVNKLFTKKKGVYLLIILKMNRKLNENLKVEYFCTKPKIGYL